MRTKKIFAFVLLISFAAGFLVISLFVKDKNTVAPNISSQQDVAMQGYKIYDKGYVIETYSSTVALNPEQLFGYADIVALGKVKKVSEPQETMKEVGGENKPLIFRDYVFEVKEAFKGAYPGDEVIVRARGGQIGKKVFISNDTPIPDTKNDQILFLKKYQLGNSSGLAYCLLGDYQGIYVVDGYNVINVQGNKEIKAFKEELKAYKDKFGDKISLPPGILE